MQDAAMVRKGQYNYTDFDNAGMVRHPLAVAEYVYRTVGLCQHSFDINALKT